jgi:hypothetical protein
MAGKRCDECGADLGIPDVTAAAAGLRELTPGFRDAVAGLSDVALRARPTPGVWSMLEYLGHVRDLTRFHGAVMRDALRAEPGVEVRQPAVDIDAVVVDLGYNQEDPVVVLDAVEANLARFADRIERLTPAEQAVTLVRIGETVPVAFLAGNVLHEATHHLVDVRRLAAPN